MKHVLIVLIGIIFHESYAQVHENAYYVSGGGAYFSSGSRGVGLLNATFIVKNNIFSLGFQSGFKLTDESSDQYNELSLSYGKTFNNRWWRWYFAAGVCRATGDWEDDNEDDHKFTTNGVLFDTQLLFTPIRYAGIGLKLTGTSRKHSYGPWVMAILHLGKMW
jgi:hypothetical protein